MSFAASLSGMRSRTGRWEDLSRMFLYVLSVLKSISWSCSVTVKFDPSDALSLNGNCMHVLSFHQDSASEKYFPNCSSSASTIKSVTWGESTAESPRSSTDGNMETHSLHLFSSFSKPSILSWSWMSCALRSCKEELRLLSRENLCQICQFSEPLNFASSSAQCFVIQDVESIQSKNLWIDACNWNSFDDFMLLFDRIAEQITHCQFNVTCVLISKSKL